MAAATSPSHQAQVVAVAQELEPVEGKEAEEVVVGLQLPLTSAFRAG